MEATFIEKLLSCIDNFFWNLRDNFNVVKIKLIQIVFNDVKKIKKLVPQIKFEKLLITGLEENFHPLNPAILSDGSAIAIRTINHSLNASYKIVRHSWPQMSINYWLENNGLVKINQPKMPFANERSANWEDIRAFYWQQKIYFLFTTLEADSKYRGCMGLAPFDDLTNYVILRGYGDHLTQKNWAPLVIDESLYFIYSWNPFIVLQYLNKTRSANCFTVKSIENNGIENNKWRGSTPCLFIPELSNDANKVFLALIHERNFPFYKSRFVLINYNHDTGFAIKKRSAAFCFQKYQIEFPAGLARQDDLLTISFGVNDRECWLAKLSLKSVLNLLRLYPDEYSTYYKSCWNSEEYI